MNCGLMEPFALFFSCISALWLCNEQVIKYSFLALYRYIKSTINQTQVRTKIMKLSLLIIIVQVKSFKTLEPLTLVLIGDIFNQSIKTLTCNLLYQIGGL